ncbi:MAG: nucleoside hydrolase [Pseudomonadota bacterium]
MGVWIDSDLGVDDLFAILMVNDRHPIDGISLVFGCAEIDQVRHNAGGAALAFGLKAPLYVGAARGVLGHLETATRILGAAGMPTRGATLPWAAPADGNAVGALADWLAQRDGARILALGPLTNLAALALAHPHLLPRIAEVVWMGGARGAGNHTKAAEFNAFADPEALAILLARAVPLTMIDLDICRGVAVTEADVAALRAAPGPNAGLLADLLGGYLDIALTRGRASMALYDPVAAAAFLDPQLFVFEPLGITVDLGQSDARGQTRVDPEAKLPNIRVASQTDAEAVRQRLFETLGAA